MGATLRSALLSAALCLGGCADDDSEHNTDADGGAAGTAPAQTAGSDAPELDAAAATDASSTPVAQPDAAPIGSDASQRDAATLDAASADAGGRPPPTNLSFWTAKRVQADSAIPLQDVRSAGQVDYYLLGGDKGEFYEISTDRSPFSPDVVVTLYDAARVPIAQNDEGRVWPGDGIDARMIVRLPHTGDYFITVEDPYTPPEFFQSAFPLLYYHLRVRKLTDGVEGVAIAHGSAPVTVTFAHDQRTGYAYATLLGEFGEATGTFDVTGVATQALIGHVLAAGVDANGSTAAGGVLRVLDAEQHLLAQIDRGSGQAAIDPPIDEASYRLKVLAGGPLGDNPFYAVDLIMLDDNPAEQDEAGNGVLTHAEAIQMQGTISRRGLLLVHLSENDVDYFKLDATENETITVLCEAESGGSGVHGLLAEVRDADDQVLGTASETAITNLQIERVLVPSTGTYYLRLASETPKLDTGSVSPWARCAVIAGF